MNCGKWLDLSKQLKEIHFDCHDCPHKLASFMAIVLKAQTCMYICSSLRNSFYVSWQSYMSAFRYGCAETAYLLPGRSNDSNACHAGLLIQNQRPACLRSIRMPEQSSLNTVRVREGIPIPSSKSRTAESLVHIPF